MSERSPTPTIDRPNEGAAYDPYNPYDAYGLPRPEDTAGESVPSDQTEVTPQATNGELTPPPWLDLSESSAQPQSNERPYDRFASDSSDAFPQRPYRQFENTTEEASVSESEPVSPADPESQEAAPEQHETDIDPETREADRKVLGRKVVRVEISHAARESVNSLDKALTSVRNAPRPKEMIVSALHNRAEKSHSRKEARFNGKIEKRMNKHNAKKAEEDAMVENTSNALLKKMRAKKVARKQENRLNKIKSKRATYDVILTTKKSVIDGHKDTLKEYTDKKANRQSNSDERIKNNRESVEGTRKALQEKREQAIGKKELRKQLRNSPDRVSFLEKRAMMKELLGTEPKEAFASLATLVIERQAAEKSERSANRDLASSKNALQANKNRYINTERQAESLLSEAEQAEAHIEDFTNQIGDLETSVDGKNAKLETMSPEKEGYAALANEILNLKVLISQRQKEIESARDKISYNNRTAQELKDSLPTIEQSIAEAEDVVTQRASVAQQKLQEKEQRSKSVDENVDMIFNNINGDSADQGNER